MAHKCPKCGYEFSFRHLEAAFSCPQCSAKLKSNFPNTFGWIGFILSLPVFVLATRIPEWATLLSFAIAGGLAWLLGGTFATVTIEGDRDAT
jgi:uncharacterized protein (UPF0212 family)